MVTTVHGIYTDGAVRLLERPEGLAEGPVLVTIQRRAWPCARENSCRTGSTVEIA